MKHYDSFLGLNGDTSHWELPKVDVNRGLTLGEHYIQQGINSKLQKEVSQHFYKEITKRYANLKPEKMVPTIDAQALFIDSNIEYINRINSMLSADQQLDCTLIPYRALATEELTFTPEHLEQIGVSIAAMVDRAVKIRLKEAKRAMSNEQLATSKSETEKKTVGFSSLLNAFRK